MNSQSSETVINLQQLGFRWRQSEPWTIDIDRLQIERGERVFIKGPSGSGKTTLLSLLAGVLTPQQGSCQLLGQDLTSMKPSQRDAFRADHIGFIFQQFNLLPYLSVIDNVTLALQFSKRRRLKVSDPVEEAIRILEHLDMADESLLQRPVAELSVGQQQRVAAARALIGMPEILIADEPTSALDADRREAFIKLLQQECEQSQTTLVFVSHEQSLQTYFDRHIELADINHASTTPEAI